MQTVDDLPKNTPDSTEVENRIHEEMWAAFARWEQASADDKPEASAHLDQTVRKLYDFVVRGKVPAESVTAKMMAAAGRHN